MTDADQVSQALAELQEVVRCRCDEAYRARGLHDPQCECDSADAVKIVADRIKELTEQLAAARRDAEIAEEELELQEEEACMMENSYFELEKELNTCRMAQAVMDNTVADLEAKLAKAVKAIEARIHWSAGGLYCNCWKCDPLVTTLTEIKGESHD